MRVKKKLGLLNTKLSTIRKPQMTKRRLDDDDLVNLLRQKHKEDPQQKQQAGTCSSYETLKRIAA